MGTVSPRRRDTPAELGWKRRCPVARRRPGDRSAAPGPKSRSDRPRGPIRRVPRPRVAACAGRPWGRPRHPWDAPSTCQDRAAWHRGDGARSTSPGASGRPGGTGGSRSAPARDTRPGEFPHHERPPGLRDLGPRPASPGPLVALCPQGSSPEQVFTTLQSLLGGQSYEEKTLGCMLIEERPEVRALASPGQVVAWLEDLRGWAEVDSLCQSIFSSEELRGHWAAWRGAIAGLSRSPNSNKRRASLVLLTGPVRQSSDEPARTRHRGRRPGVERAGSPRHKGRLLAPSGPHQAPRRDGGAVCRRPRRGPGPARVAGDPHQAADGTKRGREPGRSGRSEAGSCRSVKGPAGPRRSPTGPGPRPRSP